MSPVMWLFIQTTVRFSAFDDQIAFNKASSEGRGISALGVLQLKYP